MDKRYITVTKILIQDIHHEPPVFMWDFVPELDNRYTATKNPKYAMRFNNMEQAEKFFSDHKILADNWKAVPYDFKVRETAD